MSRTLDAEVCSTELLQMPIILSGPGIVVQIDESQFKHKRKNHTGRAPASDGWVVGLVNTSHTPALGYMQDVQSRDTATLLPIINNHVVPGTVIHSDEWRAYRRVAQSCHISHLMQQFIILLSLLHQM
uniref:ISXO2-like transposase domain-containing protein n=1 Tax=Amphimedon queenslandica TaxID=400682 RepID=A0A1X7UFG7_AMPQE